MKRFTRIIEFSKSSKITLALFTEIFLGILLVVTTLLLFLKLGDSILEKEAISFDVTITHFIYSFRNPVITQTMNTISFFGGEIFLGIAIILIILFLLRKRKRDGIVFSFILIFGIGLNLLLKYLFHRPRPHLMPLVHETSYSFPSGHSMNSFIFYTCLSFFIFRNIKNKKLRIILYSLSGGLIFLIGISRIYLGAHYPSDVLAGYIAGLCWFVVVLLFEKTIIFLKLYKKYGKYEKS